MSVSPPAIALTLKAAVPARPSDSVPKVDQRRLSAIYSEHHDFVWRSLLRLGVTDSRLDDGVHDVFMVVARRLCEFEGRSSVRTWLFAISMRVAQSLRRDQARDHRRRESLQTEASAEYRPHEAADASRILLTLLDRLDDDKRAVFVMAELEGMSAPEIAEATGTKIATVYSRLRLARAELARHATRVRQDLARGGQR